MPPKKNVEKAGSAKSNKIKPPRNRIKKEKPKLNTPTVIKVKLPPINTLATVTSPKRITSIISESPLDRKRKLTPALKLQLANEVALAHLAKPPLVMIPDDSPIKIKFAKGLENVEKRKRGRKPKVETVTRIKEEAPNGANHTSETPTVAKKRVRKVGPKSTKPKAETKPKAKPKTADTTPRKSVRRKKATVKPDEIVDNPTNNTTVPDVNNTARTVSPKKNLNEGKVLEDGTSPCKRSPSILESEKANSSEKPAGVDSRKTSLSSTGGQSWTRDISSSSTNTCFTIETSNEFVRFDKKMPVIKLANIAPTIAEPPNNDSSSSSSDSDSNSDSDSEKSTKCSNSRETDLDHIHSPSLNLSTSSMTKSPLRERNDNLEINKIHYMLEKLSSNLKNVDLEIIDWIGHDDDKICRDITKSQEVLRVLKTEREVIRICHDLKTIFGDNHRHIDIETPEKSFIDDNMDENEIINDVSLANVADKSDNEFATGKYDTPEKDRRALPNSVIEHSDDSEHYRDKYINFDQPYNNDDDDTLSLFAESLTGMDSSRINSSAASINVSGDFEEYVPVPISKHQTTSGMTYSPSKIDEAIESAAKPIVCKIQNADSTNKDCEQDKENLGIAVSEAVNVDSFTAKEGENLHPIDKMTPRLMSFTYKPTNPIKSIVFRGVCFFNLISNCKRAKCLFPHQALASNDIQDRLRWLRDEAFIQEYLMMKNWPDLRKKYGRSFVIECEKRKFTRILVEMALDFSSKTDDRQLKTDVLELTLMHMNNVDLEVCKDLLCIKLDNKLLYDVFMEEIAETPNFSRFKPVFLKLTEFIVAKNDTFSLQVANSILERFCIFPYDDVLAGAVLKIVMNTNPGIFNNSMMGKFEQLLLESSEELYTEFLSYKKQVIGGEEDSGSMNVSNMNQDDVTDRERHTSPDTTKLDTMNKTIDEPVVIRKNLPNFNRYNVPMSCTPTSSISNDSDYRPKKKVKFRQYRPPGVNVTMRNISFQRPIRPILNSPMIRHQRHVAYGLPPPKFLRRSGPEF